jgi:CDP-diacylglycerol---serine O-phosphatidyltransferase
MTKLSKENRFLDLSDYGRPLGKQIALYLKNTSFTAIHVTWMFIIVACFAIFCMLCQYYFLAALLLVLKSVLDAADGELARLKKQPSQIGRYFDSVADFLLNGLFFSVIWYQIGGPIGYLFGAFFACQLQGTLYNFYYVILRNRKVNSDTTSRIFENSFPKALGNESQKTVNALYVTYVLLYGLFDKVVYSLDKSASKVKELPKWFMCMVSIYGLGFQLLIMGTLMALGLRAYILLFFIVFSFFIPLFIGVRKLCLK